MVDKAQIELGRAYHDLKQHNEAFLHLLNSINDEILKHQEFLEMIDVRKGNPNTALHDITVIQSLKWVLSVIDDEIQKGTKEALKAAIQEDPSDNDPERAIGVEHG